MYLARKTDPEPLGNRPLIVLAAGRPEPAPPGVAVDVWEDLQQQKREEKVDLARLSRNSKLVRDPSSGHSIHVDNPNLVAHAIEEVIEAAIARTRLQP